MIQVRSCQPIINIGGQDFYTALAPYLKSFTYTDSIGKADDLSFTLADRDKRFITDSFPLVAGAELDVWIKVFNWAFPGDNFKRDCGLFEIDKVSFAVPMCTVSISGNSIPGTSSLKNTKRTRPFENTSMQQVATQIAGEQGMTVRWDTKEAPRYKRIEQNDQSDLEFIQKMADDANLMLKVKRREFIIFSEKEYETKTPTFTIANGLNMISGQFETQTADTAKGAKVEFLNPETGKVTTAEVIDPESTSKDIIRTSKRPCAEPDTIGTVVLVPPGTLIDYTNDSPQENKGKGAGLKTAATRKAKSELRKANRGRDTAKFQMMGQPRLSAGEPVWVMGFGKFDGQYIAENITHNVIPVYSCSVDCHRALSGDY